MSLSAIILRSIHVSANGVILVRFYGWVVFHCEGFPGGTVVKESSRQCRRHNRCRFSNCIQKIPWGRKQHRDPIFLPEKFHVPRSLADYSAWSHKESDMIEWQSTKYQFFTAYRYHIFFIHSSVYGHLGFSHVLAFVNSAAKNIVMHVSFKTMVFSGYMSRSGIAKSFRSFVCLFVLLIFLIFIYLFLSVLGLYCCLGISLVNESECYSLAAVHGLITGFSLWWPLLL